MAVTKKQKVEAEQEADKAKRQQQELVALRVRSIHPGGFRRLGRRWPHEFVEVQASELTDEQIDILVSDPDLETELVT